MTPSKAFKASDKGCVAAFLQSWLFLGLVESVTGKKINASYLTRQHANGQTYIYTRNLYFCLQVKLFDIRLEPNLALEKGQTMKNTIRAMNKWISRFMHWSHPNFRPILGRVFPSFMDLIEDSTPSIVHLGNIVDLARLFALRDYPWLHTWEQLLGVFHLISTRLEVLRYRSQ